jgi:hypothetical protein
VHEERRLMGGRCLSEEAVKHTFEVEITLTRCYDCGQFYGSESGVKRCPRCSGEAIDRCLAEQQKLERQLNAQKAATSRARKANR